MDEGNHMFEAEEGHRNLDETFREYAWNYFALHAEQRLKAFHFFIILATTILGGFLLLFRYGQSHKWTAVLGILLALLSFVFWKLDVRTRTLVKNGEDALKFLDAQHGLPNIDGVPHPLRMFSRDDYLTNRSPFFPLLTGHFSYLRCFNYVFVVFALIGLVGGIAC